MFKFLFSLLATLWLVLPAQAQWQQVDAIPDVQLYDLFTAGDTIYAAAADRLYISYDAGNNWTPSALIHQDDNEVIDVWMAKGIIYAATVLHGVYVSQDGGENWQQHNAGLNGAGAVNISMFAQRGDSLYVATYGAGVFVKPLTPALAGWQSYNTGMPWFNVSSIYNDQGTLLAGAGFNATFARRSQSDGQWTEHQFAPFNGEINAALAFTRFGNTLILAGGSGLYRSTDEGATWDFYFTNTGLLSQVRFAHWGNKLVADLFKPIGSALFITENQGQNWPTVSPAPPIGLAMDVAAVGNDLYLAHQHGLWRLSAPASSTTELPAAILLDQNIPNPTANGKTLIPFTLLRSATVELVVYNLQGQLVHRLAAGLLASGTHTMPLDLSGLPPGSYVYVVTANGQATAKLMVNY